MNKTITAINNIFFIGVAGTGMSAIAQYLAGIGKNVAGSDRYFVAGAFNDSRTKLEAAGIQCYEQDGSGITENTALVVVSAAVELTVPEVKKAMQLNIPIVKRSEMLAMIANSKKTIAVAGTSGKSTTCGMLFRILEIAGLQPSIISGAGLVSIIKENKIGNAKVGSGEWLVIEADESDGSIVQYDPEIGVLLNVDKDHQEIKDLMQLFSTFKQHTKTTFIVNRNNELAASLSTNAAVDFSISVNSGAGVVASNFNQAGMVITFNVDGQKFLLNTVGKHNMENALAAIAVARQLNVEDAVSAKALAQYEGIYRRHQLLGIKNGVCLIDDYAHNPAKCAASIAACQPIASKVIAWFQPHGYGPTRFLKNDFIKEFIAVLRPEDEIWMSEIFYAGGTAVKDISANDLIKAIKAAGKSAFFVENRNDLLEAVRPHFTKDCVLLLMGARDPGLENFSKELLDQL